MRAVLPVAFKHAVVTGTNCTELFVHHFAAHPREAPALRLDVAGVPEFAAGACANDDLLDCAAQLRSKLVPTAQDICCKL